MKNNIKKTWAELETITDKALGIINEIEKEINDDIGEDGICAARAWVAVWRLKQQLEYKKNMYGRTKTNTGQSKPMD